MMFKAINLKRILPSLNINLDNYINKKIKEKRIRLSEINDFSHSWWKRTQRDVQSF